MRGGNQPHMDGFMLPIARPVNCCSSEYLLAVAAELGRDLGCWEARLEDGGAHGPQPRYVPLFADDRFTAWAIAWNDDSYDTGFRAHRQPEGVYVARGRIRHTWLADEPMEQCVVAGQGFSPDVRGLHRIRRDPGSQLTVTVHAYAQDPDRTPYGALTDKSAHGVLSGPEGRFPCEGRQAGPPDRGT